MGIHIECERKKTMASIGIFYVAQVTCKDLLVAFYDSKKNQKNEYVYIDIARCS